MKVKKLLGIAGLTLAAGALLAACSSKSDSSSSSSKSGKTEITFATVGTTKPFSYEKDGKLTSMRGERTILRIRF